MHPQEGAQVHVHCFVEADGLRREGCAPRIQGPRPKRAGLSLDEIADPPGAFWLEKPSRVVRLGYLQVLALQFARFMRAVVRAALEDQPPLQLPYRRVKRPSETVILDALRDLDIRREFHETLQWYQRVAVLPYQRRLLDALGVSIDRGFVWKPSG